MPRGRPRKNVENQIDIVKTDITENKTQEKDTSIAKPAKIAGVCELCGNSVYSQLISINLESLTGKATWHRNCKLNKLHIFNKCAMEMNSIIDNFLIKKNPALRKWEIQEKEEFIS